MHQEKKLVELKGTQLCSKVTKPMIIDWTAAVFFCYIRWVFGRHNSPEVGRDSKPKWEQCYLTRFRKPLWGSKIPVKQTIASQLPWPRAGWQSIGNIVCGCFETELHPLWIRNPFFRSTPDGVWLTNTPAKKTIWNFQGVSVIYTHNHRAYSKILVIGKQQFFFTCVRKLSLSGTLVL